MEKPHVKDPSKFERFDSSTDGKNAPKSQHLNSMYVKILVVVVFFQFSPQKLGKMSNLTSIFFKGVETTT